MVNIITKKREILRGFYGHPFLYSMMPSTIIPGGDREGTACTYIGTFCKKVAPEFHVQNDITGVDSTCRMTLWAWIPRGE